MSCGKSDELIKEIENSLLMQSCLTTGGILIFIITIKTYYRGSVKILKRQHQSYALSAKDYTLELILTEKQTDYFEKFIYPQARKRKSYAECYMEELNK